MLLRLRIIEERRGVINSTGMTVRLKVEKEDENPS